MVRYKTLVNKLFNEDLHNNKFEIYNLDEGYSYCLEGNENPIDMKFIGTIGKLKSYTKQDIENWIAEHSF